MGQYLNPNNAVFKRIARSKKNVDKPAIIIELKWNKNADTAIRQIKEKNYPDSLKEYQGNILLVGISYDKGTKKHECKMERMYFL